MLLSVCAFTGKTPDREKQDTFHYLDADHILRYRDVDDFTVQHITSTFKAPPSDTDNRSAKV